MAKNKSLENLRIRNSTAEFLTFAYQTGGDGILLPQTEVRVRIDAYLLQLGVLA